jgi:hypothetical protein
LEDNIKMDGTDIGSEGVDWIKMLQDRVYWHSLVNTVIGPSRFIRVCNLLTISFVISVPRKLLPP